MIAVIPAGKSEFTRRENGVDPFFVIAIIALGVERKGKLKFAFAGDAFVRPLGMITLRFFSGKPDGLRERQSKYAMGSKTRKKALRETSHSRSATSDGAVDSADNGRMNGSARGTAAPTNGALSIAQAAMQSDKRFSDWESFQRHLSKRRHPGPLRKLFGIEETAALEWGWRAANREGDDVTGRATARLLKLLRGKHLLKRRDARLLDEFTTDDRHPPGAEASRRAVALACLLPELAAVADEADWWRGLKSLITLTSATQPIGESDVVTRQLLTIELPLTLAWQLPEVPACSSLAEPAAEFLVVEQSELMDSEGWIHHSHLEHMPRLLATWTRCHYRLEELDRPLDESSQAVWEWFVRQSIRLLRGDGTWMFSGDSIPADEELTAAAVATSTDRMDHRIARRALPSRGKQQKGPVPLDRESAFSEWAGVGVLQTGWRPKSAKAGVTISQSMSRMEICRGRALFRENAAPGISLNGDHLRAISTWEVVCDHVDDDCEHLELEIVLEHDVILQRQIFLARDDEFLLLADVILAGTPGEIEYRRAFELADGISTIEETETREIYLRDARSIRALVLPLGLPEWKRQRGTGSLTCKPGEFRLTDRATTRNLYAALVVDLRPRRSRKPRTWRQLTVAESIHAVAPDVAVAWRVRLGDDQFVIYRSLDGVANRTFLGQNHACEFYIGRFGDDGNATELISIEPL